MLAQAERPARRREPTSGTSVEPTGSAAEPGGRRSSRRRRKGRAEGAPWQAPQEEDPWTALLLAWFACRGRSLLASQCLVEAVLQLYLSGTSFTQMQVCARSASACD